LSDAIQVNRYSLAIDAYLPSERPHHAMKILCVQLGSRMYYAVPRILSKAGMLSMLHTDLLGDRGWPLALGAVPDAFKTGAMRRLANRRLKDVPKELVTTHTDIALRSQWRVSRAKAPADVSRAHIWSGDEICRRVIRGGMGDADAVFVVGSSSRLLFEAARGRGLLTINENIIAPPSIEQALLSEEARLNPLWANGTPALDPMDFDPMVRREWDLSDLIVCGSEFVRSSIASAGGPSERCIVIPYGLSQTVATRPRSLPQGRPVRVLTVGAVGLRKGSPYIMEAARQLAGSFEFRLVGALPPTTEAVAELRKWVDLAGPVSRSRIGEQYSWADIFLLPSICEGSATVIYEALGQGLPVVTTVNSGSVVTHGHAGLIVPIRDARAIIRALGDITSDARRYDSMSSSALAAAREYSFDRYASSLVAALASLASGKPRSRNG
jgi:glycosyltransferase involved in cell wall biosynthesis